MKNQILHTLLLASLIATGMLMYSCSEKEEASITPQIPACLPTMIYFGDFEDSLYVEVAYNDESLPTSLNQTGNKESGVTATLTYDDQRRIQSIETSYGEKFEFEYSDKEIKEIYFYKNEQGELVSEEQYLLYTLNEQDQIVRVEEFEENVLDVYWDFEYDSKGNVTKETYYDGETNEVESVTSYQYDDHPNPHKTLGFYMSGDGMFNPISISPNNVVKIKEVDSTYPADELEYDYDTMGNPVKMYFHNHYIYREYDSWGEPITEPEERITTYELNIAYHCQ